jgi:hypothetical protein
MSTKEPQVEIPCREFAAETGSQLTASSASQCGLQHYLQQDEPIPLARVAPAFPFEERRTRVLRCARDTAPSGAEGGDRSWSRSP